MQQRLKYIQLASEALIPLLGFFLWDWGLYFILLFYFIDLLADEVFTHLKSNKIISFSIKNTRNWAKFGFLHAFLLLFSIFSIHLAVLTIFPEIIFWQQVIDFWTYEEMGIQQGIVLVPLLAFGGYQQYKTSFLLPKKFRVITIENLWKSKMKASLIIISFAGLVIGLTQFILFPEWIYVIGIVVLVGVYQWKMKEI